MTIKEEKLLEKVSSKLDIFEEFVRSLTKEEYAYLTTLDVVKVNFLYIKVLESTLKKARDEIDDLGIDCNCDMIEKSMDEHSIDCNVYKLEKLKEKLK